MKSLSITLLAFFSLALPAMSQLQANLENLRLKPTYDIAIAADQLAEFPDNPESHFIMGVAYTRNNDIENALKQMHEARALAKNYGGLSYFDKMISEYQDMSVREPNNNEILYNLAWAYYMKGYALKQYKKKETTKESANSDKWEKKMSLESSEPNYYFQLGLDEFKKILNNDPNDVCTKAYSVYLQTAMDSNYANALDSWDKLCKMYPANPTAYFFLGEMYLKTGNVKLALQNFSKSMSLKKSATN